MILLDTNVLLRLVLVDHPAQAEAARRLMDRVEAGEETAHLAATTLSEAVFVLAGPRLRRSPGDVAAFVEGVLALDVNIEHRAQVEQALELFREHHDWDDCLLAAYALERAGGRIASFDRGLDAIAGLTRLDPQLAP